MGTALIVEDHPDQAQMVARLLRFRNFEPIIAGDGETGLKLARAASPRRGHPRPDAPRHQRVRRLPPPAERPRDDADADRDAHRPGRRHQPDAGVPGRRQRLRDQAVRHPGPDRRHRGRPRLAVEIDEGNLQGEIHVELNSEVTLLQDLNDFLLSLCQSTPLTDEQVMHLRQAVMEMAQNAIEWGNRHQSDRLVNITYRVYEDRVEIIIRDQGAGFDRSNIPHAAIADDPFSHLDVRDKLGLRSGGFGLLICEGMVDELQYNDVGNEVTLIKRFHQEGPR